MADKPKPITLKSIKVDDSKFMVLWRAHTGRSIPGLDTPLSDVEVRMACVLRLLADLKFLAVPTYSMVIGQLADYIRVGDREPRLSIYDRSTFSVAYGPAGDPAEIIDLATGRTVKIAAPIEELTYTIAPYVARCIEEAKA